MLGRVVDPLAAGGGRADAGAPRRDPPPRSSPSCCRPKGGRGEEAGPTPARAARARRDVALRRQPRAARPGPEGVARRCPGQGAGAGPSLAHHVLWCLGRLGARVPLYGPANTVVPRETAERWASPSLDRPFAPGRETTDAIFALAQLARVSGDRARDLDDRLRGRVLARLEELGADEVDPAGPSASTTSSRPTSKGKPWAMPSPSASAWWARAGPPRELGQVLLARAQGRCDGNSASAPHHDSCRRSGFRSVAESRSGEWLHGVVWWRWFEERFESSGTPPDHGHRHLSLGSSRQSREDGTDASEQQSKKIVESNPISDQSHGCPHGGVEGDLPRVRERRHR